ncbi:MAG: Cys-tRNA(Pro) deacylase [Treponema sp.]|jgi:Cys-tRNA(Pro)/Cys-tRNA(Cys) deacylase|nr:Cys-tRNA(Pro) deacylase [Treponema sp.]
MKERKEQPKKTLVMHALETAGISYSVKEYPVDTADLSAVHAAEFLDIPADQVFKTLVLQGASGAYLVCCIPAPAELDLKKVARAAGEKNAALIPQKDLLEVTGYIRGGCSPICLKKPYPVFIDETAVLFGEIAVSAGQRGMQVVLNPEDLCTFISARFADLTA